MPSIRDIFVRLGLKSKSSDFANVDNGLKRIIGLAKVAATAFAGLRAVQFTKGMAEETRALGDRLDKVSQQIGLTTDALQELEHAAGLSGVSNEEVSIALRRLARNARDARGGVGGAADDFERLGVSVVDSNGELKDTATLVEEIAGGMQSMQSETEKTAVAATLFGRAGAKLIPMLNGGASGIRAQREEARRLGLMDDELIRQSVILTDNQLRLSLAFRAVKNGISKVLLPAWNALTVGVTRYLQENRRLIVQRITDFFRRVASVADAVADTIMMVVRATAVWIRELGPLGKLISRIVVTIAGLAAILLLPGGSILLLVGLLALLVEDFQKWRAGSESVIGDVVAAFGGLLVVVDEYRESIELSVDAFAVWVDEHRAGISIVTSLIAGLATVITGKLILANQAAIASWLRFKIFAVGYHIAVAAQAVASAAKAAAAWVAAATRSAVAWLASAAPLVLTAALLSVIVGTVIYLGREMYRLAVGQENLFSTMSEGVAELSEQWGGLGPAIGAMLDEALRFWLDFFGSTNEEIETLVANATDTLTAFWDNVLEYWGSALTAFLQSVADKLSFLDVSGLFFSDDAGPAQSPSEAGALAGDAIASFPERGRIPLPATRGDTGSVTRNATSNVSVTVTPSPGMDERSLAEMTAREIERRLDAQTRQAMQSFVVEGT